MHEGSYLIYITMAVLQREGVCRRFAAVRNAYMALLLQEEVTTVGVIAHAVTAR